MSTRTPTYYEILGLKPSAKHTEVGIAYNRLMAAQRRDSAVPDLKAQTRLREWPGKVAGIQARGGKRRPITRAVTSRSSSVP